MIVRKAFKYRIYPNREQQQNLAIQFGHSRNIYNWGLAQSQDKYPGYHCLAKQLPILKASEETCWLREAHSQILQQSRKNLDRAFRNFFEKRGGYPQFKSKRARQRMRLARLDEWIANQRRDFHHKVSRQLVEENQFIGLEYLNIQDMMACEASFAHYHLAKSIGDAGCTAFIAMLVYKGDWYGYRVEKVNRWYPSSKTCFACGTIMLSIPLHVHQCQCPVCGVLRDRDVKRSRNGCCHSGTNILNQTTVGARGSNAWGQPRPKLAAATG